MAKIYSFKTEEERLEHRRKILSGEIRQSPLVDAAIDRKEREFSEMQKESSKKIREQILSNPNRIDASKFQQRKDN